MDRSLDCWYGKAAGGCESAGMDGSLILIGILIFVGMLVIWGIAGGGSSEKPPVKPKPAYIPPPSVKESVRREFGELRDVLSLLLDREHHRLVEITCTHVDRLLDGYEGGCKKNAETYGGDLEKWLREECECPAPRPGKQPC
jgi:hypothetical protein